MNLLLRLLWLVIASRARSAVPPLGPCRTPFRVWPTDLDVLRHVNNGIYLSIMDLARVDLMMRSGFAAKVKQQGWFPVVVAETIQFRRSLRLLQRFDIETRVVGWDEKAIVIEQQFFYRGEVVAHALVRARFLSKRGGAVTPRELVALLRLPPDSPAMNDYTARWNAEQTEWKGSKP
jgi:YbgC/YbaW family acyl-CoA thioester hydrolase